MKKFYEISIHMKRVVQWLGARPAQVPRSVPSRMSTRPIIDPPKGYLSFIIDKYMVEEVVPNLLEPASIVDGQAEGDH